jgi:hypothetical protein
MSNTGLGPTQRAVLGVLEHLGRSRVVDVRWELDEHYSYSAIASALHRLEARGLVKTLYPHRRGVGATAIWERT